MSVDRRAELRTAVLSGLGVALVGLPVGLVWWLIAPLRQWQVSQGGAFPVAPESEAAIAADGWFAVCSGTAGLVCALLVFARTRHARVGALAGLVGGGLVASVIAWRLGVWLGPASVSDTLRSGLGNGAVFDGPLQLSAKGVLLVGPMASSIAYFALTAGLEPAPRAEGMTGVNGVERTGVRFPVTVLRPGYAIDEVDLFFARLEAGEISPEQAGAVRFGSTRLRRGYDEAAVDAALAGSRAGR
jgi:DivIVA domain-containing protein